MKADELWRKFAKVKDVDGVICRTVTEDEFLAAAIEGTPLP